MDATVFIVVLIAALLHASWNALVKSNGDKFAAMLSIVVGHVPFALVLLLFLPLPSLPSYPFILGGVILHIAYQLSLYRAYQIGDLTQIYPIARGIAPILVMIFSVSFLAEELAGWEIAGILAIAIGILSIGSGRTQKDNKSVAPTVMATITGCCIAGYSLVDGWGARLSDSAVAFYCILAIGNAALFALIYAAARPGRLLVGLRSQGRLGMIGGTMSFCAYALVVWSFNQAPIALVSALRETSIIFALIIGAVLLREPIDLRKVLASFVMATGAMLAKFGRTMS